MKVWLAVALAMAALGVAPPAQADRTTSATVIRWSDGDTVVTDRGTVRLIGIDAPEDGTCGHRAAGRLAARLAPPGSTVTLTDPASVRQKDRYGRLLRYVGVGRTDIGRRQLKAGSQARYDSTDGYDRHPRQRAYRKRDIAHRDHCGSTDLRAYAPAPDGSCPSEAPIKGNRSDQWIYHLPANQSYAVTNPEECFASGDGAKLAGYRAALA